MSKYTLIGSSADPNTWYSKFILDKICRASNETVTLQFEYYLEYEFIDKLTELRSKRGGALYQHEQLHLIFKDDSYFGSITQLVSEAEELYQLNDVSFINFSTFEREAVDKSKEILRNRNSTAVWFAFHCKKESDISLSTSLGKVVIELFDKQVPNAAQNFRLLCTGERGKDPETGADLWYRTNVIHRVVKGGYIQFGDLVDCSGNHNISTSTNGLIEDEYLSSDFGVKNIVGLANTGPHTNGSQVFIITQPSPWLTGKGKVAIGRVIEGERVVKAIEEMPLVNDRPVYDCMISSCGVY